MAAGWRCILATSMDYKPIKYRWYSAECSLALGVPVDVVMDSVRIPGGGRNDRERRRRSLVLDVGIENKKTVTQDDGFGHKILFVDEARTIFLSGLKSARPHRKIVQTFWAKFF